jgi:hypothetical protein
MRLKKKYPNVHHKLMAWPYILHKDIISLSLALLSNTAQLFSLGLVTLYLYLFVFVLLPVHIILSFN